LATSFPAKAQEATPTSCVAAGRGYRVGETACIPACHGQQRLARCEQTSNGGATWTSIADTCPNAMGPIAPPNFTLARFGLPASAFVQAARIAFQ
jgi:hypothetical protein